MQVHTGWKLGVSPTGHPTVILIVGVVHVHMGGGYSPSCIVIIL